MYISGIVLTPNLISCLVGYEGWHYYKLVSLLYTLLLSVMPNFSLSKIKRGLVQGQTTKKIWQWHPSISGYTIDEEILLYYMKTCCLPMLLMYGDQKLLCPDYQEKKKLTHKTSITKTRCHCTFTFQPVYRFQPAGQNHASFLGPWHWCT